MSLPSELELIEKLVADWHLNVHERNALPDGEAKGSLIVAAIERSVLKAGYYPSTWRRDDGFDGGLVELKTNGSCTVYWKREVSMSHFELKEKVNYSSLHEACAVYAQRFFGDNIDGIHINWAH